MLHNLFQINLKTIVDGDKNYRTHDEKFIVPDEINDVIQDILGFDNEPVFQKHIVSHPMGEVAPMAFTPVTPAQVLVLGAGVAGLQAIATARRLGAVVSAYDVRPSSADEVKSMGASFIDLNLESLAGAGGYAREMTEERAKQQQDLLTPYIAKSNVVITTAAVPGRTALDDGRHAGHERKRRH